MAIIITTMDDNTSRINVHNGTIDELVEDYEHGDSDYDKADSEAVYEYTSQLPIMLTDDAVEDSVDEYRQTDAYNDAYNAVLSDIAQDSFTVYRTFKNEEEAKKWLAPYVRAVIKHSGREAIDGGNRDWLQKNNNVASYLQFNFSVNGEAVLALINYIY